MTGAITRGHNDEIFFPGTVIEITTYNIPGLMVNKELFEHILHQFLIRQYSPLNKTGVF